MRIISLLPSATDTLCTLGVGKQIIARTHECDQQDVQNVPIITSSKVAGCALEECDVVMRSYVAGAGDMLWSDSSAECLLHSNIAVYLVDYEKMKSLKPDVIFTQLQEIPGVITSEQLMQQLLAYLDNEEIKIINMNAQNIHQIQKEMLQIAEAVNKQKEGEKLVKDMLQRFEIARRKNGNKISVAFIQWMEPCYIAGGWVAEIIKILGGVMKIGNEEQSQEVEWKSVKESGSNIYVFNICGCSLKESMSIVKDKMSNLKWKTDQQNARFAVMDGRYLFCRTGLLLLTSMETLSEIMYPELQGYGHQGKYWDYVL